MMFFFKRKKIHLDCFTQFGVIATDNPIQKTSNFFPTWWKNLPRTQEFTNEFGVLTERGTLKNCPGFKNLYLSGLTIPLWCDLNIKIADGKYAYQFKFNECSISEHPSEQYGNVYGAYVHIKINNIWRFREKTGIKFLFAENPWEKLLKFPKMNILSGIVDFTHQSNCNINAFFPKENNPYQTNLKAGTPLIQLIPISDKQVNPIIHVLDEKEFHKICRYHTPYSFTGWYSKHKKTLQKNKIK